MDEERNRPESVLLAVTSLLLIFTTLFTAVRCWAKSSQQLWTWFDTVFSTAFLVCAAQCTAVFLAVAQYGFGTDDSHAIAAEDLGWQKTFFASDILYIVSIGLSRSSTAFFLSGLTRNSQQKVAGVVIAVLAIAWAVASVFAIAVRGDLAQPWRMLEPPFVRWIGVEASGLVVDLACWCFSISLVWTLNMPIFKRLRLIIVFALRLLLAPIITLRLLELRPNSFDGSVEDIAMVQIYTQTAMHFALIAECLTCLRPFMATFHEGLAPANASNYWGAISQVSQPGTSNRSGTENDLKKHIRVTASQISEGDTDHSGHKRRHRGEDGSVQLRSDRTGFSTRIESKRDMDDAWSGGDDDIELLPTNRSIRVRQTMVMSISNK